MDFLSFIKGEMIIWTQPTQITDFTEMWLNGFREKNAIYCLSRPYGI